MASAEVFSPLVDSGIGTPFKPADSDVKLEIPYVDLDQVDSILVSSDIPYVPSSPSEDAISVASSERVKILLQNKQDITPVNKPLFQLPKPATASPMDYMPFYEQPYGQRVAEWQQEFFGEKAANRTSSPRSTPAIAPLRPEAPTMIAFFYPDPNVSNARRPLDLYLKRLALLARFKEQTIVYCPPWLVNTIQAMRPNDPHWIVIDDFESIWDVPNNKHQKDNFTYVQPPLYNAYVGTQQTAMVLEPAQCYNKPFLSAIYNAKVGFIWDAIMRNPFGSERFMYMDGGLMTETVDWANLDILFEQAIDDAKVKRATKFAGTTGVVVAEYTRKNDFASHGYKHVDHDCWHEPTLAWLLRPFVAYAFVGGALGMLNFCARYMQTVDDMDANGYPTGRDEYLWPHIAIRYPNTVFSIPQQEPCPGQPLLPGFNQVMKTCFSGLGGPTGVPAIHDPIATLFCEGYIPRHRNLNNGELCDCQRCCGKFE